MKVIDEAVLVVGDHRRIEFLVVDDVGGVEGTFLLVGAVLAHTRNDARGLSHVSFFLVRKDVDHGPVEDLVVGDIEGSVFDALSGMEGTAVDEERRTLGHVGSGGCRNGNHSSVYFRALPRDFSTGYFAASASIFLLTASGRSTPSASAR